VVIEWLLLVRIKGYAQKGRCIAYAAATDQRQYIARLWRGLRKELVFRSVAWRNWSPIELLRVGDYFADLHVVPASRRAIVKTVAFLFRWKPKSSVGRVEKKKPWQSPPAA
jgi:hypothetical protein